MEWSPGQPWVSNQDPTLAHRYPCLERLSLFKISLNHHYTNRSHRQNCHHIWLRPSDLHYPLPQAQIHIGRPSRPHHHMIRR